MEDNQNSKESPSDIEDSAAVSASTDNSSDVAAASDKEGATSSSESAAPSHSEPPKNENAAEEVAEGTVLVVDDSAPNRRIVRSVLEKINVPVLECEDGLEAKKKFNKFQKKFVAIISDINMPGLDGVSLLEEVRKTLPEMPFFLITGEPYAGQIVRAKELKVNGIIVKPLKSDSVLEKLAMVFPHIRMKRRLG